MPHQPKRHPAPQLRQAPGRTMSEALSLMQQVELHLVTRKCYHVVACRLLAWSTRCSLLDSLCQLLMPGHCFGCLEALPITNALVSPLQSGLSASDGRELRHVLAHVKRHGSWAAGHHIMPKPVAWRLPWLFSFFCRQCCQRSEGSLSMVGQHQLPCLIK